MRQNHNTLPRPDDIAILKLSAPLNLNTIFVRSIALHAQSTNEDYNDISISGFGVSGQDQNDEGILRMGDNTIDDYGEEDQLGDLRIKDPFYFTSPPRAGAREGDSGGPVVRKINNNEYLQGMIIDGFEGKTDEVAVTCLPTYSKYYRDWIINQMKK